MTLPSELQPFSPITGEEEGGEVALHYGWPANEQDAYEDGNGFAYLGAIGIVQVSGEDRLSWLTTLSSQVFTGLTPGASIEALLLDPQGRVEFQMGGMDDGATVWLITDRQAAHGLAEFLDSMRFMLRVEVRDVTDRYRAVRTDNEKDTSVISLSKWVVSHGGVVWTDPWPGVTPGGARYHRGQHPGEDHTFRTYVVPKEEIGSLISQMTGGDPKMSPVGSLAAEATRVSAWRPNAKTEVDERAMPSELDLLRTAVHLEKGCYKGQESVARIVNLGRPPRRLVFLHLDGSGETHPEPGDSVEVNGRKVGHVTSVAEHWEMGPIALALVKRNLDLEAQVKVGGVDASQEAIVPLDGKSDHSPAQRPGAGLRRLPTNKRDIRTTGPGTGR